MANPSWAPSPADVAALIPDRVQNDDGVFDETSTPTAAQVNALIASICADVQGEVGVVPPVPTGLGDLAKRVAALGVAADIELGYTSSEADEKYGQARQLADKYTAGLARLRRAVEEVAESGTVGPTSDVPLPVFGFPDITDTTKPPFATTWDTRF